MDSRRYLKRVWRVPKDRGAVSLFATLCIKALVKHGWPADWRYGDNRLVFDVGYKVEGQKEPVFFEAMPADFQEAVEDCVQNVATQQKVGCSVLHGRVQLDREYTVKTGGFLAPCLRPDRASCRCGPSSQFICSHKKWKK